MTSSEPKYVVGFLFNKQLSSVVLISKTKPRWQNGLLNGVGGKVEPGEFAKDAMVREFMEETGVDKHLDWKLFANFFSSHCDPAAPNAMISCFTAKADDDTFNSVRTTTEEEVMTLDLMAVQKASTVPNLKWLVPLAVDFYRENGMRYAEIVF